MDWTNFWAANKKEIDPIAPRHTAVEDKDIVKATVINGPAEPYTEDKPKHGKNPAVGMKKVVYSKHLLFDQADAKSFKQDEEITLMNWGNAFMRKIVGSDPVTELELELHLEGDVKKTEKKVTWLSTNQDLVKADLYDFDYLSN
jgi:glutamyl-tRNA synthetase